MSANCVIPSEAFNMSDTVLFKWTIWSLWIHIFFNKMYSTEVYYGC